MREVFLGEVVDTYGGDYTHRNTYYEEETDCFYIEYTGARPRELELVRDEEEIENLRRLL